MTWRVLVLVLVLGCGEKKEAEERPQASGLRPQATKGKTPADAAPPKPDVAVEAKAFLAEWVKVQNEGDFEGYKKMYAEGFQGVRRSGKSEKKLDRAGWMADREKMFKEKMEVSADNPVYKVDSNRVVIDFEQTWESGTYADRGSKRMTLLKKDGVLAIVGEEMLSSTIVLLAGGSCEEVLVPEAGERPSIRGSRVLTPTAQAQNVCIVEKESGSRGEFIVAVLARSGKRWSTKGSQSFEYEKKSDPDNAESRSAELEAELVDLSPTEQGLLVDFVESNEQPGSAEKTSKKILYRLVGSLQPLIELEAKTETGEVDQGTEHDLQVSRHVTRGFYDVAVTTKTYKHQWPVDEHEEHQEATHYLWDGSGYSAQ